MTAALRKIEQLASKVAIVANAAGTLVVLGLVMVVNYDVVALSLIHI